MLTGSICLSDIPQEYIFTSEKTGKKYLKIQIKEKLMEQTNTEIAIM